MVTVRKASERGRSQNDWLDSRHTFSFAEYHDPRNMGFGHLRVINEDTVAPGQGFGRHPHRDMEILSYVLEGSLEHGDSTGNGSVIRPGDVQVMSAGTGVVHSERNHSPSQPVHFLQIWIEPDARGVAPRYEQKRFSEEQKQNTVRLIASRDGREGSVTFHQDASLYTGLLDPGGAITMPIAPGRRAWVQVVRGEATVNGETLAAGDGAAIQSEATLELRGRTEPSEVLVFDLG
jgi:redox-sensitive bicupin YhaK (pirin superfamily)